MTQQRSGKQTQGRAVKAVFGVMALGCLLAGLVTYLFAADFGFSEEAAQIVAIAFLVAGVIDYIMLKLWDRIFSRR